MSFIIFISLFFCSNLEKSLSFFPIFKTATPSLISILIYIYIRKLNINPSYLMLFLISFLNEVMLGGNLINYTVFMFIFKYFSENFFLNDMNKNNQEHWISFTMIFISSFFIIFFMNILLNLTIPDLSPIFFHVGITLIIFPIINLCIDFISFIKKLIKN